MQIMKPFLIWCGIYGFFYNLSNFEPMLIYGIEFILLISHRIFVIILVK